jgi:hypothetical protein
MTLLLCCFVAAALAISISPKSSTLNLEHPTHPSWWSALDSTQTAKELLELGHEAQDDICQECQRYVRIVIDGYSYATTTEAKLQSQSSSISLGASLCTGVMEKHHLSKEMCDGGLKKLAESISLIETITPLEGCQAYRYCPSQPGEALLEDDTEEPWYERLGKYWEGKYWKDVKA